MLTAVAQFAACLRRDAAHPLPRPLRHCLVVTLRGICQELGPVNLNARSAWTRMMPERRQPGQGPLLSATGQGML